jgi:hypothetical protein
MRELNVGIGVTGLTVTATPFLAGVAQAPIAMTELGTTGVYEGDMTGAAGTYQIAFISAGVTKGSGEIKWTGTAEVAAVGPIPWTYTVTDSVSGLPIEDVGVWVTSDAAGLNVIANGRTNSLGVVSFFLDAGTVYVWRQHANYNFTDPDIEVVA